MGLQQHASACAFSRSVDYRYLGKVDYTLSTYYRENAKVLIMNPHVYAHTVDGELPTVDDNQSPGSNDGIKTFFKIKIKNKTLTSRPRL